MQKRDKAAVVVFAREPAGRVKTRLIPALGAAGAQELHFACLKATLQLVACLPGPVTIFLYLTSATLAGARRAARALRVGRGVPVRRQGGGDLGARLERMFAGLWGEGFDRVVVIGSDSPTLAPRRLREALTALRRADAVLGPARDGGYYLLGLRRTERTGLLRGIAWGTARAFAQTRRKLRAAELSVRVLPPGYDVDTPADLRRLEREVRRSRKPHLKSLRAWLLKAEFPRASRGVKKVRGIRHV